MLILFASFREVRDAPFDGDVAVVPLVRGGSHVYLHTRHTVVGARGARGRFSLVIQLGGKQAVRGGFFCSQFDNNEKQHGKDAPFPRIPCRRRTSCVDYPWVPMPYQSKGRREHRGCEFLRWAY